MTAAIAQIAAVVAQAWKVAFPYVGRFPGALHLAIALIVPAFRTAGYFQNALMKDMTPAQRMMGGVLSGWPAPVNPLLPAFLSGVAYPNTEELAEGWLSTFGQLMLKDVVKTDLSQALEAAEERDVIKFFDALAQYTSEETGLESLAAFFRGWAAAADDWEALTGFGVPMSYIGELVIWLDRALQGFFDPFPLPPDPGRPKRSLEEFTALTELPDAEVSIGGDRTPVPVGETVGRGTLSRLLGESGLFTFAGGRPAQMPDPEVVPATIRLIGHFVKAAGPSLAQALKIGQGLSEDIKKKLLRLLGGVSGWEGWETPGGDGDGGGNGSGGGGHIELR